MAAITDWKRSALKRMRRGSRLKSSCLTCQLRELRFHPGVRRRFALFSLLTAWLFATGSQWDVVQVFAWGKMFIGYARTASVSAALEQTFDPEKPCALCCAVRKAKQQQESKAPPPEVRLRDKVLLIFQPVVVLLARVPDKNIWRCHEVAPLSAGRAEPPVPPPRGVS